MDIVLGRCTYSIPVKLGSNTFKRNNVFSNKIKPLHVSANDGHHRKATNTSKEMLHTYYMHVKLDFFQINKIFQFVKILLRVPVVVVFLHSRSSVLCLVLCPCKEVYGVLCDVL
jgi:hypothetical protein